MHIYLAKYKIFLGAASLEPPQIGALGQFTTRCIYYFSQGVDNFEI